MKSKCHIQLTQRTYGQPFRPERLKSIHFVTSQMVPYLMVPCGWTFRWRVNWRLKTHCNHPFSSPFSPFIGQSLLVFQSIVAAFAGLKFRFWGPHYSGSLLRTCQTLREKLPDGTDGNPNLPSLIFISSKLSLPCDGSLGCDTKLALFGRVWSNLKITTFKIYKNCMRMSVMEIEHATFSSQMRQVKPQILIFHFSSN